MANDSLLDSDLLLLLKRRLELFKKLLQLSQRQFTESDPTVWNWLLGRKQECIDELQRIDELQSNWVTNHEREFSEEEVEQIELSEELLRSIQESENKFERMIINEKYLVSNEMEQLGKQLNYSSTLQNYVKGRPKRIS